MVVIYSLENKKYLYVKGDDSYLFYYLFNYHLKNDKCYFKRKSINKILTKLKSNRVSYSFFKKKRYLFGNYKRFVLLGKKKYDKDIRIDKIKMKLLKLVDRRDFNKIIRKIEEEVYE